jgi:hypothetical protein
MRAKIGQPWQSAARRHRPGSKAVACSNIAQRSSLIVSDKRVAASKGSPVMKKLEATNDDGQISSLSAARLHMRDAVDTCGPKAIEMGEIRNSRISRKAIEILTLF